MDNAVLQAYLVDKFKSWQPSAPQVVARNKGDITLDFRQREPFGFLKDQLLYRIEKNNKIPKWVVVYNGGKTTKLIDNLEPRHPHRFRLRVILRAEAVPRLAALALEHYGDECELREAMQQLDGDAETPADGTRNKERPVDCDQDGNDRSAKAAPPDAPRDAKTEGASLKIDLQLACEPARGGSALSSKDDDRDKDNGRDWLQSRWSQQTWTGTGSDGSSATVFCMAVRGGHLKQVAVMAEERPELVGVPSPATGLTPLAAAVCKGDISMVRLLLALGADVSQPALAKRSALHLAALARRLTLLDLLLERGADFTARDCNGMRVEHFAVDSGDVATLRHVLDRGGDLAVADDNGWTPLFRALVQGAPTALVAELVSRGGALPAADSAGLAPSAAARLLRDRHGRPRDSVLRLLEGPDSAARDHFTRLSRKIYHAHALLRHT